MPVLFCLVVFLKLGVKVFCVALSCRFYEVNNVNHFQFSRGVQKGEVNKDNEFSVSYIIDTGEPPVATTSRLRPPLLRDQFSKIPKVFKSNHYVSF